MKSKLQLVKLVSIVFISLLSLTTTISGQEPKALLDKPDSEKLKEWTILNNLFDKGNTVDDGREVRFSAADSCIDLYEKAMKKHGIQRKKGKLIVRVKRSRMITFKETFAGKELLVWFQKIVRDYDPNHDGTGLVIDVEFGIYTNKYLDEYVVSSESIDKEKRRDRIAIFLVARRKPIVGYTSRDDDGLSAFDLGGIQP